MDMQFPLWKRVIRHFLPLAAVIVTGFAFSYLLVQQQLRMGANDPQVQMAEDAARSLAFTAGVEQVVPAQKVDVSRSLAPFLIVYDSSGKVLGSSADLNGRTPELPEGVLQASLKNEENRVTWQPAQGVRIAAVIKPVETQAMGMPAYVLAGRSLRESEARADQFLQLTAAGMVFTLLAVLVIVIGVEWIFHPKKV
jgi:hypothetical protein